MSSSANIGSSSSLPAAVPLTIHGIPLPPRGRAASFKASKPTDDSKSSSYTPVQTQASARLRSQSSTIMDPSTTAMQSSPKFGIREELAAILRFQAGAQHFLSSVGQSVSPPPSNADNKSGKNYTIKTPTAVSSTGQSVSRLDRSVVRARATSLPLPAPPVTAKPITPSMLTAPLPPIPLSSPFKSKSASPMSSLRVVMESPPPALSPQKGATNVAENATSPTGANGTSSRTNSSVKEGTHKAKKMKHNLTVSFTQEQPKTVTRPQIEDDTKDASQLDENHKDDKLVQIDRMMQVKSLATRCLQSLEAKTLSDDLITAFKTMCNKITLTKVRKMLAQNSDFRKLFIQLSASQKEKDFQHLTDMFEAMKNINLKD